MSYEIKNQAGYDRIKSMSDTYERARIEWCIADGQNPKGWTSMPTEIAKTLPFGEEVTNELRSALEVWEFKHDIPEKYFLYIDEDKRLATTWTGDVLGVISFGRTYTDNFGGKRVPVSIKSINGRNYFGTYFKSAGQYARVKITAK